MFSTKLEDKREPNDTSLLLLLGKLSETELSPGIEKSKTRARLVIHQGAFLINHEGIVAGSKTNLFSLISVII